MSERLPERVNPFLLAERGRVLEGVLPLNRLPRLAEVLAADVAEQARVRLAFMRGRSGIAVLDGEVSAELALTCQRCLEPMAYPVESRINLALVESDAEAARLQEGYDTLLVEDETLSIPELIEDELLLALPLVPMHDATQACSPRALHEFEPKDAEQAAEGKENPFAILKNLKPN